MTEGLRERKKSETRRALMHAALELVTQRGYDSVTVDEIAATANVSTRTFFRYFEHKADAIYGQQQPQLEAILESEDVLSAGEGLVREFAERLAADPELYATQVRLGLAYPPVRTRRIEVFQSFQDAAYAGFRQESPNASALECHLAAIITVQMPFAVLETWIEAGAPASGPAFEEGLTLTRRQVEALLGR